MSFTECSINVLWDHKSPSQHQVIPWVRLIKPMFMTTLNAVYEIKVTPLKLLFGIKPIALPRPHYFWIPEINWEINENIKNVCFTPTADTDWIIECPDRNQIPIITVREYAFILRLL